MKASEVEGGGTYTTKVGTRTVEVRIVRASKGGWDATSVATGKPVRVKDAARLKAVNPAPAETVEPEPDAPTAIATPKTVLAARKAARGATKAPRAAKAKEAGDRPLSCLDAAAAVLKAAGEPLQCKVVVERMAAEGLWTTKAPTPAATLYSAILRELKTKGKDARFKKTDRGHFALNA
jgi:hypothetical protein